MDEIVATYMEGHRTEAREQLARIVMEREQAYRADKDMLDVSLNRDDVGVVLLSADMMMLVPQGRLVEEFAQMCEDTAPVHPGPEGTHKLVSAACRYLERAAPTVQFSTIHLRAL